MATDTTMYTLSADPPSKPSKKSASKHHRRGGGKGGNNAAAGSGDSSNEFHDDQDGANSLTYSVASSIASSAAGESTDSSFAEVMRVLDLQDSAELAAFMKKEGVCAEHSMHYQQQLQKRSSNANASVAGESLAYSTDMSESALGGEHLLQTITGQPSDSYGPDGGGLSAILGELESSETDKDSLDVFFAPAEPTDVERRSGSNSGSARHHHERGRSSDRHYYESSSSSARSRRGRKKRSSRQRRDSSSAQQQCPSTPPPVPPRRRTPSFLWEDEDSIWYAKWWMCGFVDAFRDLVPKR